MYNVLIVDDELWFRSYLKELIDQCGGEFLVCAQAANGAEALKILKAQPVDVVIADVLMPVMDGVELMRQLSAMPRRLPVLALSNCDDYPHVRQMLQLGAQDYLLKHEISAAALREHLQRAADWIQQQATVNSEQARERDAEAYVRKNRTVLKNEFLHRILTEEISPEELQHHMDVLGIQLAQERLMLCLLTFAPCADGRTAAAAQDDPLFDYGVLNIVEEILHESGDGLAGSLGGGVYVLLFSHSGQVSQAKVDARTQNVLQRISFCMKNYFNRQANFCMDKTLRDMAHLREGYRYVTVLKQELFYHDNTCVLCSPEEQTQSVLMGLPLETEKDFAAALEAGTQYETRLNGIFDMIETRRVSLENARMILNDLLGVLNRAAKKHGVPLEYVYGGCGSFDEIWRRFSSVADAKSFFSDAFSRLVSAMHTDAASAGYSYYVRQTLRHIQTDYAAELSVSEIAEQLGISGNYLSKLFKEETGTGFAVYLTDYRIERSIALMKEHRLPLSQIAEQCGFRQYTYFTNVFKKKTGKSPRAFLSEV